MAFTHISWPNANNLTKENWKFGSDELRKSDYSAGMCSSEVRRFGNHPGSKRVILRPGKFRLGCTVSRLNKPPHVFMSRNVYDCRCQYYVPPCPLIDPFSVAGSSCFWFLKCLCIEGRWRPESLLCQNTAFASWCFCFSLHYLFF